MPRHSSVRWSLSTVSLVMVIVLAITAFTGAFFGSLVFYSVGDPDPLVRETECNGFSAHRGSDWEPAEGESRKDVGLDIRPGMPSDECFITYSEGYAFRNRLGVPAHVCVGMRGRCQSVHGVSPLTVPPGRIADMELPMRSYWIYSDSRNYPITVFADGFPAVDLVIHSHHRDEYP